MGFESGCYTQTAIVVGDKIIDLEFHIISVIVL